MRFVLNALSPSQNDHARISFVELMGLNKLQIYAHKQWARIWGCMLGVARRGYDIDDATINRIKEEDASRRNGPMDDPRALFRAAGVL